MRKEIKEKGLATIMLVFLPITVVVLGLNFLWYVLYEFSKELCKEKE